VRPPGVVPVDPLHQFRSSLGKAAEVVLPRALLLQASKETLHEPVLLRRVRSDEFLLEPVVAARRSEATTLEDEPVVAAEQRCRPLRSQRSEASDAGFLGGPLGLLGSPSERKLVADDFPSDVFKGGPWSPPAERRSRAPALARTQGDSVRARRESNPRPSDSKSAPPASDGFSGVRSSLSTRNDEGERTSPTPPFLRKRTSFETKAHQSAHQEGRAPESDATLFVSEAARRLGVSVDEVYRRCHRGTLPFTRPRGRILIPESAVHALLAKPCRGR